MLKMNSLNADPNPNMNPNKFKSFDIQNQFYQYYRIPNNPNISPDFGHLQNPYGTNPLLATQFSFQYSDNQGLGDGINTNNHSNVWNTAPLNATLSSQARNTQHQAIDPNSAHFFSIPPHASGQATDQNLFYQYRYGTANNMFWTHPSMLEYKSGNQNYSLTTATAAVAPSSVHADKSHSWSEALINNHYAAQSLTNPINYKTSLSPIDQSNTLQHQNILSIANGSTNQSGYQQHGNLGHHNGYALSAHIDSNGSLDCSGRGGVAAESAHISGVQRQSLGKSDIISLTQDKSSFSVASSSNNINAQVDILQSQMASDCSIHKDGSNFEQNRSSNHNSSQQNCSPKSQSKHTSPNMDQSENSDFWNQDVNRASNCSSSSKSYAKVAKQPSRNTNCPNNTISNQTSSTVFYPNNGISGNARANYKSSVNGFATGYSRSTTNNSTNNSSNNWFSNSSTQNSGNGWNVTKPKWTQESRGTSQNSVPSEPNVKSSWAAKVTLSNAEENIKNAEYKMKEFQSQINPKRLDLNFEKTRYFVIKSYSEDDVHRSIKYKIWCSTKEGNKRLNEAFLNAQKIGGHVLLFFSVNGSGHFCGIAEMTSCVDESVVAGVWCQDKWKGRFSVKWIYVKDVPNTQLRHISTKVQTPKSNVECTEIKPITNLRDATELKSERTQGSSFKDDPGYQALRIIMDCKSSMSIFDDYIHYEKRELGIES